MQQKYLDIKNKFLSLEADLQNPVIINDVEKLKNASQEYTDLKSVAEKVLTLESIEKNLAETELIVMDERDEEMRVMAATEIPELKDRQTALPKELDELTRPKDPM